MALQTVFSSNLDPAAENLSSRFTDATAFYIDAPLIDSQLEIDVFLQVYFPVVGGERTRVLSIGKISEASILLNVTDTESVITIPSEYVGTGLEMALLFLASSTTYLEAYAIGKNCTLCQLKAEVETINRDLNLLETTVSSIETKIDKLGSNQGIINNLLNLILSSVVPGGGVLIPASIEQQQFFFLQ